MLHLRIHSEDYPWLIYITLFDTVIISLMYLSKKTIFSAFILNTVLFVVGVIAHLTVAGGWGDVLMAIPDFSIGYVLNFIKLSMVFFKNSNLLHEVIINDTIIIILVF